MTCFYKAWLKRKSGMVSSVSSFSTLKYRFIFTFSLNKGVLLPSVYCCIEDRNLLSVSGTNRWIKKKLERTHTRTHTHTLSIPHNAWDWYGDERYKWTWQREGVAHYHRHRDSAVQYMCVCSKCASVRVCDGFCARERKEKKKSVSVKIYSWENQTAAVCGFLIIENQIGSAFC